MRVFWLILPVLLLCTCQNASVPGHTESPPSGHSNVIFAFSNTRFSADFKDPDNWCNARQAAAALVSADPNNFYRRLFALETVPCRVVVNYNNMSSVFMLHKMEKEIHLYTGENLPACLSRKDYFQVSPSGQSFKYDNKTGISYEVHLQELPDGIQIALDLPANGSHGMTVYPCEGCQ